MTVEKQETEPETMGERERGTELLWVQRQKKRDINSGSYICQCCVEGLLSVFICKGQGLIHTLKHAES